MKFEHVSAVVTGANGQKFHGFVTASSDGAETIYQFTFDGGFESIAICKVAGRWIYAGGMRIPNEHWISELGEQIDAVLNSLPSDILSESVQAQNGSFDQV